MTEQERYQMTVSELARGLMLRHSGLKPEKAIRLADKYLRAIQRQIAKHLVFHKKLRIIQFSTEESFADCGDFLVNKTRYYVWNEFQSIQPIVKVLDVGSNQKGKYSFVSIDNDYLDMLIANMDVEGILDAWWITRDQKTWDIEQVQWIPVDLVGLRHFILNSTQNLPNNRNAAYYGQAEANVRVARQLLTVVEHFEGHWPHLPKSSEYGRTYYHGLSLQNVKREVRHAALGHHYSYDLDAACYAVRLALVDAIYQEFGQNHTGLFTNTKDYLNQKSARRRYLAQHIQHYPDGERLIKEALNAIGFGARLTAGSWINEDGTRQYSAMSDIIRNPEDCNRFITDPWVVEFTREQDMMTQIITEYYLQDSEFVEKISGIRNMLTTRGTVSRRQMMAYLYQQAESKIMRELTQNLDVVIGIHDGFITKKPIPLADLRNRLREIAPYLDITVEEHKPFRTADEDELEHRDFIRREEQRIARLWNKPIHQPIVKESWHNLPGVEVYTSGGMRYH